MPITLMYFGIPGGRAGAIRAALLAGGVEFEDKWVSWDEYQAAVKEGKMDAVGMPQLEVDGVVYTQSLAIARFVAKKAGLYPTDDAKALLVDEVEDICQDVLTSSPRDPDAAVLKTKREEYAQGKMKTFFNILERRTTAHPGPYLTGDSLTIGDLVLYYLYEMIRSGNFTGIPTTYIEVWPGLTAHEKTMEASEVLQKYKKYWEEKKGSA